MNPSQSSQTPKIRFDGFSAWYHVLPALRNVNLQIFTGERLAVIGPAGSGKTTLLHSLNRLSDPEAGFRHQGQVLLDGHNIFEPKVDLASLRRRVGLMSTPTTALPVSIFENIAIGLRMAGERRREFLYERVESGLKEARLWDEVKNQLHQPAQHLSLGLIKRLSLARALAFEPEVLLFDEPESGLDNIAATLFEDILHDITPKYAIVYATNDIKLAARASDRTAFFLKGELIECGPTRKLFTQPSQTATHDFTTERF
jgi:phosphate transport system ATP-binding protein